RFTTKITKLKPPNFSEIYESAEQRNHVCSKPFHLLAILRDVLADGIEQDHLGAGVDDLTQSAHHIVRGAGHRHSLDARHIAVDAMQPGEHPFTGVCGSA